ncbi:MAG: glycoside hydrolase family 3 protein [Candidatus Kapabacteria bacterium]|nr:glycoside hydrolase family 3 protein [Ignavibacteriota bacterium]MCW5885424.1 glycoside hydrolase family 3 protein [Candidatus Kapabacteria bacterium]
MRKSDSNFNPLIKLFAIFSGILFMIVSCDDPNRPQDSERDLDLMIGQMLMIGFRGVDVDETSPIVNDIRAGRVGGVILFDKDVALGYAQRNIVSPEQVEKLNSKLQSYSGTYKLLIAVDQEGGRVARLKTDYGFLQTVTQQYLGTLNNPDTTKFYADRTAETLNNARFNVNFAPVVDLNVNPNSPAIGALERSFSREPHIVISNSEILIKSQKQKKVLSCLKHFPGHGSASADSHLGFTDITNSWSEEELVPYRELIKRNEINMIMTAHVFNSKLDSVYPATLSGSIISGILRGQLGFDGVVVSDDMNMKAISEHYGLEYALEMSIKAGVDVIVFGNNLIYDDEIASKAVNIIKDLVYSGKISKERIKQSYKRIVLLKSKI